MFAYAPHVLLVITELNQKVSLEDVCTKDEMVIHVSTMRRW